MTPFSQTADGAVDAASVPALLGDTPGARRSLLDRIDSPRAVFGVLGTAAVVGLALAFAVVHGLERLGNGTSEQHAARGPAAHAAPHATPAPAPPPAVAETLSPAQQYQALNGASARGMPPAANGASDTASGADRRSDVPPEVSSAPANPQPQLRFKLTAPYIPPIARSARPAIALAPAPRIPPSVLVAANNALPSTAVMPRANDVPQVTPAVPSMVRNIPEPPRADTIRNPAAATNAADPAAFNPEHNVASVLQAAARAEDPAQERSILDAAENVRRRGAGNHTSADTLATARRLNEEANRAYWINKDVAQALQLERRAYDANPNDVEIAGNLAFYYLKQSPAHAAAAREVALHALTANSPRYRTGRLEDWMSLGIANALMGRREEAENAFLASAALGNNLDRACRGALSAVASYGEAVRPAAIALLRRVHAQGRSNESPYCAWPPDWALGKRYP